MTAHVWSVTAPVSGPAMEPPRAQLAALLASLLVLVAVLTWPRRRIDRVAGVFRVEPPAAPAARSTPSRAAESIWTADPLELWRAHRARRARDEDRAALAMLDIVGPALRAGLTAERAFELALAATGEPESITRAGHAVGAMDRSVAIFWRSWAEASGSDEIAFVAGAWTLSEQTGAPLADAVDVGAEQLRARLSHRRRLRAATAGPQATVQVLSVLPLTGPLFGLAAGVGPVELYLASPAAAGSLVLGLGLLVLGRWWCRRLVHGAGRTR